MILIGISDCPTCKIVKRLLMDVRYVELQRMKPGEKSIPEIFELKKILGKMNPDGKFPVIINDDLTKIILTQDLLNNLQKQKLENMLK